MAKDRGVWLQIDDGKVVSWCSKRLAKTDCFLSEADMEKLMHTAAANDDCAVLRVSDLREFLPDA